MAKSDPKVTPDMTDSGQIFVDGELFYDSGKFKI